MTNADDTPKVDLGAIKQELDAIEQELGILPTESDVVEERNNPLVDESTPAKRKGTRRDTECRWLDEAENMIQQGETEDTRWLDDAERDIDTFLVGDRKGMSKKRNAIRKQMTRSNTSIKLAPVDGKPFESPIASVEDAHKREDAEAARAVFDAEVQLNEAELEFGKESVEAAQKLLIAASAYFRQRQFGLSEMCAKRSLAIFNMNEGVIGCSSMKARLRLMHIAAMQGKWDEVDTSCSEIMKIISVAPTLTKELVDMVDQIGLLTRIKCKMRHTPTLGTATLPKSASAVSSSKVTPL